MWHVARAGDRALLVTLGKAIDPALLAMGLVAQMPAITYVLARMGLVTARWMLKVWRIAVIVILIVAAVLSPTNDVPNMLLFAAPMFVLYAISIIVAWICGRKRQTA